MSRPVVAKDGNGQPLFLGECHTHGWHGRSSCPKCGYWAMTTKTVPRTLAPLNARYRPGEEIIAFGMTRRRFWTDGAKAEREGHCRMCRRSSRVRQLTRHHLIPQQWWRQHGDAIAALRNAAANVVPLCRACHDDVERNLESRRMLRRVLTQTEIAFVIDVRGIEWFDGRYPSR